MSMNITAYRAAEIIQSRFRFNDDNEAIDCQDRYMSDFLGSDWSSGMQFDNSTPVDVFYSAVREKATRIYGNLPF